MSWANDIVASLATGDVVPGKMKGLVLTLGRPTYLEYHPMTDASG